ncbi:MAG: SGNH/GDSL hydrolase family protein [Candidatus Thorarchaeota archaeon]|jgi:lysophospholipase L1-like esterase
MPKELRILGFGNSLTAGTPGYDPNFGGNEESQYCYWLLKAAVEKGWNDLHFDNQGVPGELAESMRYRLEILFERRSYDVAVMLGGTNDIGWGRDPDDIIMHLSKLWNIASENGVRVVVCTIPPIGLIYPPVQKSQSILNNLISIECNASRNLVQVDLFNALSDSEGFLKSEYDSGDGLHFSVAGYQQMGRTIWDKGLERLLRDFMG